jgi:hypothetical protein
MMKNSWVLFSLIVFMVAQPQYAGAQGESVVIVTGATFAGRKPAVDDTMAVLNQIVGPRDLPAALTYQWGRGIVGGAGIFYQFTRADAKGLFWNRYWATISKSDPSGHGHFQPYPNGAFFLWEDAWLILRHDNDSLVLFGKRSQETQGSDVPVSAVGIPISSTQGQTEQDILPALFAICPHLGNPRWNGGSAIGRIYFYRGGERVGSAAPIGVSLNGMFIGYLLAGKSYFYIDEPAGNYTAGWRIDYHANGPSIGAGFGSFVGSNAVGFTDAMPLTLAAGETKFIRFRVRFGFAHPTVNLSTADQRSASHDTIKRTADPTQICR